MASIAGLVLAIVFSSLAELMGWHYLVGLILIIGVSPLITFFMYKYWAFTKGKELQ